jgi:hypothetical protein
MWTILVVVGDELAEDQRQVVFIQHDDVVQALAPQGPDDRFDDRDHSRRSNRRRLDHLAPHPRCGRIGRHVDMHQPTPAMGVASDPLGTPQSVVARHARDQLLDFGTAMTPSTSEAGLPPPEQTPTLPMPAHHRPRPGQS